MPSANAPVFLNPLTPLAFLPTQIGDQLQIGNYIVVGTLAAFIWDLLCNLLNDYKLLTKYRIGVGTLAYFAARIFTLWYLLASTIFLTHTVSDCAVARKFYEVGCALAVPANALLMFLRARAIFLNNTPMVLLFLFLWLAVAGTAIIPAMPGMITAAHIGPTRYCITIFENPASGFFGIAPAVHDTVVFVAISWRMFQSSHFGDLDNRSRKDNIKAAITGELLPRFSQAILQDGQLYYLITVLAFLPTALVFSNKDVTPIFRTMFFLCTTMVTNCMACHVFRNIKFGYHGGGLATSQSRSRASRTIPMFHVPGQGGGVSSASVVIISRPSAVDVGEAASTK